MSVFDQNNPQENSEELLYQAIKEELKPILEEWSRINNEVGGFTNGQPVYCEDDNKLKLIKETSKIVMQFIWRKLGLKMPDYTRRVLDENFNIMELIDKNK